MNEVDVTELNKAVRKVNGMWEEGGYSSNAEYYTALEELDTVLMTTIAGLARDGAVLKHEISNTLTMLADTDGTA